jgi:hypothetical protein
MALNLAKLEGSKGSMKEKTQKSSWNDDVLVILLAQVGKTSMRSPCFGTI